MKFTFSYSLNKFKELRKYVINSDNAIASVIASKNQQSEKNAASYQSLKKKAEIDYESQKSYTIQRVDSMLKDALSIYNEIDKIESTLIIRDKYYRRTKDSKEAELRNRRNASYDGYSDYFDVLEKIRRDFEALSRKYREHILPGIINGIHYIFSSKRKADYEELIVLKHTVQRFVEEIKKNIGEIRSDALEALDDEYKRKIQTIESQYRQKMQAAEKDYADNMAIVVEAICDGLNVLYPNDQIEDICNHIVSYQNSLASVSDKKTGTKSILSMFCTCIPLSSLGTSDAVKGFVSDTLNSIVMNSDNESYLLTPCVGYTDESSNWYLEWDGINREYVHEVANNIMFSLLSHIPVGHLKYLVVDPIGRGTSVRRFFDARKKIPELFYDRICFNTSDIDEYLSKLCDYIDETTQSVLGTKYASVFDYAEDSDEYQTDIVNLLLFDFPKGLTESSLELINNILIQGPKCGVFTTIAATYDDTDQQHSKLFERTMSSIQSRCNLVKINDTSLSVNGIPLMILSEMPNNHVFSGFIDKYLLIRESIINRGLVFPIMIKKLIASKDEKSVKKQIDYIVQFETSMNQMSCFNTENKLAVPREIGIAYVKYPTSIFEDSFGYQIISNQFAKHSSQVTLPFAIDIVRNVNIHIKADGENYNDAVSFSNSIIWHFISALPVGLLRLCLIDPEGMGHNAKAFLDFCANRPQMFFDGILSKPESIRSQLTELISEVDEITYKKLGSKYSNIIEYNEKNQNNMIPLTLLVVYDYPSSLDGTVMSSLLQIIKNGNRCGIFTLFCSNNDVLSSDNANSRNTVFNAIENQCTTFEFYHGSFKLLPFNVSLSQAGRLSDYENSSFVSRYLSALEIIDEKARNRAPDNDYTVLFDISHAPEYKRGNKKLHLPYGISASGELYYCDFENENFAAFLCGSAGSGKSTLLHSLITGILLNNHPDDVELWLADFKMKEFMRYIDNCPPHIKYILLEESSDAVYDFLDRMNEKLCERERLNSAFSDFAKAPVSMYLPIIFVIIDEFSIMSQIIDRNEEYKLILQNLLAKGRALGFRFLFSSQTFTTGITGLTQTAKKQIQMRLAMKSPQDEISETIDMSKSLMTDEQKRWLLTLPKYYILLKKYAGEGDKVSGGKVQDDVVLTRAKGLYFPDYEIQNQFIRQINQEYVEQPSYKPEAIKMYKSKEPVMVDGSVYFSFNDAKSNIIHRINLLGENGESIDTTFLFLGCPRSMHRVREISIENEFEENVIVFGTNIAFVASVFFSAFRSIKLPEHEYLDNFQVDSHISFIGYKKNRLCKKIIEMTETNWENSGLIDELVTDELSICKLIHDLKDKIERGETESHYVFIAGLDVILKNLEFMAKSSLRKKSSTSLNSISNTDYSNVIDDSHPELSVFDVLALEEDKYGISVSEEDDVIEKVDTRSDITHEASIIFESDHEVEIYDIREDLQFILTEGPRLGYHVFAGFRTYDEFRLTRYSIDLFKHKLTFQCSKDDSRSIIQTSMAYGLGENAFVYTNMQYSFTMRPYLHSGLSWDNWITNDDGKAELMKNNQ